MRRCRRLVEAIALCSASGKCIRLTAIFNVDNYSTFSSESFLIRSFLFLYFDLLLLTIDSL